MVGKLRRHPCWGIMPKKKSRAGGKGGKLPPSTSTSTLMEIIWSVRHDDGEAEDYNALELATVLCDNFDAPD
jgi:hypothetical protein